VVATTDARRLIINADDLGFTEGVTRGILEAHAAGAVTSASMMVNTPGFDDAVRRVAGYPALSVGLHLNLTAGRPVSDPATVPSLVDPTDGRFLTLARLAGRALSGRIRQGEVFRECAAQIGRLREAGIRISHLDSHRHVHALPGILQPVVAVARQEGITALRRPIEPLGKNLSRLATWTKRVALRAAWRTGDFPDALAGADHFRGLSCRTDEHFQADLLDAISDLPPGTTELMVHPGHADALLRQWDGYAEGRESELVALCSTAVRQLLNRGDICLVSF
jgi:predicted glycoside hydrolase/deacetylase ChbG (UPF0249 family)